MAQALQELEAASATAKETHRRKGNIIPGSALANVLFLSSAAGSSIGFHFSIYLMGTATLKKTNTRPAGVAPLVE